MLGKSSGPGTLRRGLELPMFRCGESLPGSKANAEEGRAERLKKTEMLLMVSFELLDPTVSVSPATSQGESLSLALGVFNTHSAPFLLRTGPKLRAILISS